MPFDIDLARFAGWLWSQVLNSVSVAAVLGLLGLMFKEKWKQVLARSLNADTEQIRKDAQLEIECAKAAAQQELEEYKVSLIAEAERHRAKVEVAKEIAISHTSAEYEALMQLHAAVDGAPSHVLTFAGFRPDPPYAHAELRDEYLKAVERIALVRAMRDKAAIFLTAELSKEILLLCGELRAMAYERGLKLGAVPTPEEEDPIRVRSVGIASKLEKRINSLATIA